MRSAPPATRTTLRLVARGENPATLSCGAVRRARSSARRPRLIANRFCSSEVCAFLGTSTSVPSQLMPAKPVPILSLTPSSTEVITTSAKTPSMRSVRVRSERSLCAHSSISPPVITSHTSARRTPIVRRRTVAGPVGSVRAGVNVRISLIAQCLHRRLPAGLDGGAESEQEAEDERHQRRPQKAQRIERQRHADREGDHPREGDPDQETDQATESRQQQ